MYLLLLEESLDLVLHARLQKKELTNRKLHNLTSLSKEEGKLIFDGIMLGVGVPGSLKSPIELTLKGGRAVEIKGGDEAKRLREVIEGSDKNANVIGEFAIGTSEKEIYGSPSEKGMLGTMHCALGDNSHCYPGGQNVSRLHLDGTTREVTIEVDGKLIMKSGKLVI